MSDHDPQNDDPQNDDPFERRIRRLTADAVADAPTPLSPEEMTMNSATSTPSTRSTTSRRWLAVASLGTAAALVAALIFVPRSDDAGRPVDTPLSVTTAPTDPTTVTTIESVPDITPDTTPGTSPVSSPDTTPATTTTEPGEPVPLADPTVIAAVDAGGDAVLISADGTEVLTVLDGPVPDEPVPDEGPGPNSIDGIALTPNGSTVFVGMCCEPVAGSILSGLPSALSTTSTAFGYAPAVSPDGRVLAVGQIAGPALDLTDMTTGSDLAVPDFTDEVGVYSPYDTMWLDDTRVLSLGLQSLDEVRWIVVPMVIDGDEVTVGETLLVDEALPASVDGGSNGPTLVRFAGSPDGDRFAIHTPGEGDSTLFEFRLDGFVSADSAVKGSAAAGEVDEGARSIWYRPQAPTIWVGGDGVLHRGDATIAGSYLWARPTDASSFTSAPSTGIQFGQSANAAIDLTETSAFGLSYGAEVDVDDVVAAVTSSLGTPTVDTDWQPTPDGFECSGPFFRTVWWGDFRFTFERFADDSVRVAAWSVGDPSVSDLSPFGELPDTLTPSGVAVSLGIGVGSDRSIALEAAEAVGRMIGDEPDQITVTGAIVTVFRLENDTVTGIGSGRLDCIAGDDL